MSHAIAVIIPAHNAEQFIDDTIDSVVRQTHKPAEVIVVDDASSDGTCAIVDRMAAISPVPIRLIRLPQNTGGPATPINVGIEHAGSPLIALLDHDDVWLPHKLALQVEAFRDSPDLVLAFGDYIHFGTGGEGTRMPACITDHLRRESTLQNGRYIVSPAVMTKIQLLECGAVNSCSNLMFPRRLWLAGNHFDPRHRLISDYLFKLKIASEGPAAFLPEVLFRKRVHGKNTLSGADLSTVRDICDAIVSTVQTQPVLLADREFRDRLRHLFIAQGWHHRERGHLIGALSYYWNGLRCAGFSRELIRHLAAFPLGVLRRAVNGPAPH